MKRLSFVTLACLSAVIALTSVGCKTKPIGLTPLPSNRTPLPPGPGISRPLDGGGRLGNNDGSGNNVTAVDPNVGTPLTTVSLDGREQNRTKFEAETIHFDLDKAIVKTDELPKISKVADFLKVSPGHDILVEGHCDERGTEGYNISLGDRRALAVREALITAGAPAEHVHTVSFGESRPVDSAHNEAAWAKNRRSEFILVLPAK
jgi:peptidoglycan-associated lipoprotein